MSISDVFAEYDRIRAQNKMEENRRLQEVYQKVPEVKSIHQKMGRLQIERIKQAILEGSDDTAQILSLREQAAKLLQAAGFDVHYLDPVYTCPVCRDTGMRDDARRCDCFKKRVLEDKLDEARLTDNDISFEQFDISIFDDTPMENGKSQRDHMIQYKKNDRILCGPFPGQPACLSFIGPDRAWQDVYIQMRYAARDRTRLHRRFLYRIPVIFAFSPGPAGGKRGS